MTPFFFFDAEQPLYGVHHEPSDYSHRNEALLVCHGLGRDYMRSHRGLVLFAEQMAQAGYHVLRFDYYATGDSYGEDGEGGIQRWLEDIAVAGQEAMDLAGVDNLSVVGVRMGGSLACLASRDLRIKTLVMWDPVVDGARYIKNQEGFSRSYYDDLDRFPEVRSHEIDAGSGELLGVSWPAPMRHSVSRLNLLETTGLQIDNLAIVRSASGEDYADLQKHLSGQVGDIRHSTVAEDPKWEDLAALGNALAMHETLSLIKSAIGESDLV